MPTRRIKLLYFSPTGTTRRVIEGIAQGFSNSDIKHIDLTRPTHDDTTMQFAPDDVLIIGAPVYAGRVPETAVHRFQQFRGNNTPAILVAVYGNREFEDALLELKMISTEQGFVPIAGAAFIGEHSFETEEKPVARGRPDSKDIQEAIRFGKTIETKIQSMESTPCAGEIHIPGNFPYKDGVGAMNIAPETDMEKCILCGECVEFCPTDAISLNGSLETNTESCIRCSACVKQCSENARSWHDEKIQNISNWLHENFSARKDPELYGV